MKICFIATRHRLDDARVVHKEAQSLVSAGHEVILLLCVNDNNEYLQYDGSVLAKSDDERAALEYMNMKIFGFPKRTGILGKIKMLREMSLFASSLDVDAFHVHEPDLALAIGIRAKILSIKHNNKTPALVHDFHEYPPGQAADAVNYVLKPVVSLSHKLWLRLTMRWVDHVFTANSIVRGFVYSLDHMSRIDVLYNVPKLSPSSLREIDKVDYESEPLVICHEGSLPFNRGLRQMIDVLERLQDKIHLLIIGDVFGEEKRWLENEISMRELENSITITGWLPYSEIDQKLNEAHMGLILFQELINNRLAGPPNKLFNYMRAGLPVISVDFPEMRRIITEENCGVLLKDQSVTGISQKIEQLMHHRDALVTMGENGQKAVRNRYSWDKMEKRLLHAYAEIKNDGCK